MVVLAGNSVGSSGEVDGDCGGNDGSGSDVVRGVVVVVVVVVLAGVVWMVSEVRWRW
ncbi:hypothetical protein E2C01_097345 [Portunus trituberculatus]|uniref:Transmembrane protein n=1 Tax=Portunus trituberculatus TaxID=210409 RepID=A0A5B7K488_PORTR|nr:hypothetical protein [Portunus trituberculatus]